MRVLERTEAWSRSIDILGWDLGLLRSAYRSTPAAKISHIESNGTEPKESIVGIVNTVCYVVGGGRES